LRIKGKLSPQDILKKEESIQKVEYKIKKEQLNLEKLQSRL